MTYIISRLVSAMRGHLNFLEAHAQAPSDVTYVMPKQYDAALTERGPRFDVGFRSQSEKSEDSESEDQVYRDRSLAHSLAYDEPRR
jgi:hypothetical protein